ncbi:MAG: LacI family transcriptional regulator [Pseudonocardiales bacterium]|jgi:LacI family transcriptional regulator|nr:LacI family transcriptional regulator [Pseudonocardiales bacterium]
MTRRVRLSDVAALAATSTKTASRVINGHTKVGSDTRDRVEKAVRELGYRPDPLARSLRRGTDDTIGVVVDEVSDPFFASVIGEIERMALDRAMTVIVASTQRLVDREHIVIDGLLQRRVAGLIIASVSHDHAHLKAAPCPVVFIDRVAVNLDSDAVLVDDRAGARLGVDHLISHGHKRIAYLGDHLGIDTARSRLDGYRESLELAGIAMRDDYVIGMDPSLADGGQIVEALLATPEPPTAIFSANTRCSLRVLSTLHRLSRTDIAFVSFGDFAMADALTPPITVIDHSPESIGRLAADRLLRRMAGDEMPTQTITTPLHLVPRGSGELAP